MRAAMAAATLCGLLGTGLAGCAAGPDPSLVQDRAQAVFDDLVAELEAVDPAVLRTVEVLPPTSPDCGGGATQDARVARGTLSVRAVFGDTDAVLSDLADRLAEDGWRPAEGAPSVGDLPRGERALSSPDGITVTLADASPVLLVAVFSPCLVPR